MAAVGMQPVLQGMPRPAPKNEELVPNLNNYVRGKLSKSEGLTFADCARALGQFLGWLVQGRLILCLTVRVSVAQALKRAEQRLLIGSNLV